MSCNYSIPFCLQSVLSHYNSNVNDTIEGPELYAFVGDMVRYLGLKFSLSVVQLGVEQVQVSWTSVNRFKII